MVNNKFARTMNRTNGVKAPMNPHATNAAKSKTRIWQKEMISSATFICPKYVFPVVLSIIF